MSVGLFARRIVYTAIVCGTVFFLVGRVVRFVERYGWISLDTPDSSITYLVEPPYVRAGERYVTDPVVRTSIVNSSFRAVKGNAWRMFVLGESFAMGTPYVMQDRERPGDGGMASWLTADLEALFPSTPIEIINAAAGGQSSYRVRQIAQQVVQLEPDAILVAACNNEGTLPPGRVDEILHQSGAYRLLAKLTARDVPPEERSYFTPQDPDVEAIRAAFEENLRLIIDAAHARHVEVLLCTMPVNLRYAGGGAGHIFNKDHYSVPEPEWSPCTVRATELLRSGDAAGAIDTLRSCESDLEGVRLLGLSLFAAQRYAEAHQVLSIYTELAPRNRCKPSLNRVIREQARRAPWVHLVDLEAAAEAISPGGIPGDELFLDYCHMNWAGYAAMADVVRKAIVENGIGPRTPQRAELLPSRIELAERFGLPDLPDSAINRPYRSSVEPPAAR